MRTTRVAVSMLAIIAAAALLAPAQTETTKPTTPAPAPQKPAGAKKPPEKWIGVRVGGIMPMVRMHLKPQLKGLPDDGGLMIYDIVPESPAVVAGVERFDVLLRADGQALLKADTLQEILNKRNFGTSIRLDLIHEGQIKSVYAIVLERPEGEPSLTGGGGRNFFFGGGGGGPGGRGGMFGGNPPQVTLSYTDTDGNEQKITGDKMGEFWQKVREDEKFREAIRKNPIEFRTRFTLPENLPGQPGQSTGGSPSPPPPSQ